MAISYAELKRRAAKDAAKISKEYGEDAYGGLKFLNDPDGWKKTVQQQQKSKKPTQNRNSGWSRSGLSRDAYDARVRSRAAEKLGRYGTGFQSLDEAEEKLNRWSEELTQQQALLRQVGDAREKTGKQITQLAEKMTKNAGKDWNKSSYGDDSVRLETLKSAYSQLEADYQAREEVLMRTYRGLQAGKSKLSSMIGEQEGLVRDANRTLTTPDWIMADRAKKNTAVWDKKKYGTQVWEMPTTADALLEVARQAQAEKEQRKSLAQRAQKKSFGEASREWEKKAGDAVKSLFAAEPAQKEQSLGQRAWNTIAAAGTGLAAQFAGVPAYVVGRAGEGEAKAVKRYADAAKRYRQMAKNPELSKEGRAHYAKLAEEAEAIVRNESGAVSQSRKDAQKMYAKVDKLSAVSENFMAAAKDGLSAVGRFGVDAAVGGLQLLADIGLGAVTGGGALVPMAVRGFGGASQEARRSDTKADTNQQGLYGLASAGLSLMTEKVSNVAKPLAKAFGKGVADDALEAGIRRAFDSLAKTPGGKQAAQRLASMVASGTGEGFEEALEGALTPVLQRMIYDPKAQWDWAEIAREGLLGAAIGSVAAAGGGVGEHEWNQSHPGKAAERYTQPENAQETLYGTQEGYDTPATQNATETQKTAPWRGAEESTSINTDPARHTPAEQAVIAEYQDSVDDSIRKVFSQHLEQENTTFSRHNISDVSTRQAQDVERILGKNVQGYKNAINSNGVRHILGEHGPNGTVDHSFADLNDVARIGYVLENYDNVDVAKYASGTQKFSKEFRDAENRPAPMLIYDKKVNGTYYVVEAVPDTKYKKMWVVSAYMAKKGDVTQALDANSPENTPYASLASSSPTSTVTQAASGVKAEAGRPAARQVYDGLRLENAGAAFGENGAKALRAAYGETRGEVSASDYYGGFAQYYHAGLTGAKPEQVRSDSADVLTQAQKFAAYTAGQNDAAASLAQERQAARFASTAGEESGLVYDAFVQEAIASGRQHRDSNGETRTYLTAETAETLNRTAKALGVRVRFVDSVAASKANAQIRGSEVLVERNNPNPVRFLFGHEFTHRLQQLAPREYRVFRDAVLQGKEQLVQARIDSYGRQGVELDYESAMDEVAADYAGLMMDDGKMLDRFVAAHKENRTLLEKVRDVFRQLADKLTGAEKRKAQTAAGKLEAALEAAAAQNQKLENAKTGKKKGAAGWDEKTWYSINEQFGHELREWAEDGRPAGARFVLGSTGPVLHGLGAIESDIYMNGDKINLILQQHPEMTLREIQKIPELLEDPTLVLKSRNAGRSGKNNTRLVLFGSIKARDGRPVLCVLDLRPRENGFVLDDMQRVTSAYTKDSNPVEFVKSSDVMFADKKRATRLLSDIGFQTPIPCNQSGYVGSIAYARDNVKLSGVPFSAVFDVSGVGERTRYSFGGINAKNANLTTLQEAQEMQKNGADMEDIRKATGWHRFADGKWRFELDDSKVKLRYETNPYDYKTELREKNRAWDTLTGRRLTEEQRNDLAEYAKGAKAEQYDEALYNKLAAELGNDFEKWAETLETVKQAKKNIPNAATLGDLVDAPELFAAYPDMADVDVLFQSFQDGQNGGYNRKTDDIYLNSELRSKPEALLDTLIHEVQHAVQNREGFSHGANPAYWNRKLENGFDGRTAEAKRPVPGYSRRDRGAGRGSAQTVDGRAAQRKAPCLWR